MSNSNAKGNHRKTRFARLPSPHSRRGRSRGRRERQLVKELDEGYDV